MLAFVTSLRHPDNSLDYSRVEELLARTLESIDNQTDEDHVVIVVGNVAPQIPLGPKVQFVKVDFEAPVAASGLHADRSEFVLDKGAKIGLGLWVARRFNPDWAMIVDADDFVHRGLVEYFAGRDAAGVWVIRKGLLYSRTRNGSRPVREFNRTCGTSFVVPYEYYGVPNGLRPDSSKREVIDAYGEVLTSIIGAHRSAEEWHLEHGRAIYSLPFAGAVYQVDTGENHSGKSISGLLRPWDRGLEETYAIRPSRSRLETLRVCLSPRALGQSLDVAATRVRRVLKRQLARGRR